MMESLESRSLLATNGLSVTYFDRTSFTGRTASGIDSNVNHDWGNHESPAKKINGDTFSARWNGLVRARVSETYTFSIRHNDGVRLWINGSLIIDSWGVQARKTSSGSIALKANKLYDIRLEYFDFKRTAAIQLQWSSPTTPIGLIPTSRLFAYDTRVAAIGDYGKDNDFARGTAKLVNGWKPQTIVTVGDNNYQGLGNLDQSAGQYFSAYVGNYQGDYGAGAATNEFFPAFGDHDYEDGPQEQLDYFTLPGNERYYDFIRGPVHFFVLNSNSEEPGGTEPDSTQGQWLESHLASSTSAYNLVVLHHAPYSSGGQGDTEYMQWPFKDWGADVVIAGHDHNYERLVVDSLTYVVDGAGGGPVALGPSRPETIVRNATDSGALLIQANDLAITFQYQLRSGEVIDTFTLRSA